MTLPRTFICFLALFIPIPPSSLHRFLFLSLCLTASNVHQHHRTFACFMKSFGHPDTRSLHPFLRSPPLDLSSPFHYHQPCLYSPFLFFHSYLPLSHPFDHCGSASCSVHRLDYSRVQIWQRDACLAEYIILNRYRHRAWLLGCSTRSRAPVQARSNCSIGISG